MWLAMRRLVLGSKFGASLRMAMHGVQQACTQQNVVYRSWHACPTAPTRCDMIIMCATPTALTSSVHMRFDIIIMYAHLFEHG